jgi:hypothetical protein
MEKHLRHKVVTMQPVVARADLTPPPKRSASRFAVVQVPEPDIHAPMPLKYLGQVASAKVKLMRSSKSEVKH